MMDPSPLSLESPGVARSINPDAGWHQVTTDEAELAAIRRASQATHERFPYFDARYGERGRLFADSDSAWVVTFASDDRTGFEAQTLWLGHVLASRGVPRWLLERHLEILHQELTRTLPESGDRYANLAHGASRLRRLREERIAAADFQALADEFNRAVSSIRTRPLPYMGEILVSAVADRADGIDRAVASVEEWATDATRFPQEWIAAVAALLSRSRAAVRRPIRSR